MTLIPQLLLNTIPEFLHPSLTNYWQAYLEELSRIALNPPEIPEFWETVFQVFASSHYVAEQCISFPTLLDELFNGGDILREYRSGEYVEKLTHLLVPIEIDSELEKILRQFRCREMIRIIWRDLANWSSLATTLQELSALADACIDQAARRLYLWQCRIYGSPQHYLGEPQNLVVLAMGKLGGEELNLSSDVDLIFSYPASGETQGVKKPISHEEFFHRLGQRLIHILSKVTQDGFVFRVDMRLRPLGASGPLVVHFSAIKNYYQDHGRDWERYALVKARVVSGNQQASAELMNIIRHFVYRNYLDFSVIEALRRMHHSILQEGKKKRLQGHVKLGMGGIREVEFIGQAYQLIRGGENPWLQDRRILTVLTLLADMELITEQMNKELSEAYVFLRKVEHCLQAVSDRQVHDLPEDSIGQCRLAFSMNFSDWDRFVTALHRHRINVHNYFQQLIAKPKFEETSDELKNLHHDVELFWLGEPGGKDAVKLLTEIGFEETVEVLQLLTGLQQSSSFRNLDKLGRSRLNELMPLLLMTVSKIDHSSKTLRRILGLLEAILEQSNTYLVLLLENPKALKQLVRLCSVSSWIAEQLALYPLLLGELLDPNRLYAPLDLATLEKTLRYWLSKVDKQDLEGQMEVLRRFKLIHIFRVAAMDVTGVLPLMRVSDHLTNIACIILLQVESLAWQYLTAKHGFPQNNNKRDMSFAIIAYGKLGGIELGYNSDLDLVFLYDKSETAEELMTDGEDPITYSVFYTRLGQRIIQMLGTQMTTGLLYTVDTRLRPSGESGLLIASIDNFDHYQHEEAWTWEHQALVRARAVSGCNKITKRFSKIRNDILGRYHDPKKLLDDICEMRKKMRETAKIPAEGQFDLKQGLGGITDIEFIVQYCVLRWGYKYSSLYEYTDNIRILEALGREGLLAVLDVRLLSDAYRAYRAMVHLADLQKLLWHIPDDQFRGYREGVVKIWQKLMVTKNYVA